jgi:hypothetical protein
MAMACIAMHLILTDTHDKSTTVCACSSKLNQVVEENMGMAMIYTLVEAAKEWLRSECFVPKQHQLPYAAAAYTTGTCSSTQRRLATSSSARSKHSSCMSAPLPMQLLRSV